MTEKHSSKVPTTAPAAYAAVAVLSAILGFAAVYAILRPADKSGVPAVSETVPPTMGQSAPLTAPGPARTSASVPQSSGSSPSGHPLATGEMLTFVHRKMPEPLPPLTFEDGEGRQRSLADFKGKVLLLNLWATWCAPCRKEMPALDRLQALLGGQGFEVLALSVDRQGAPATRKFLSDIKVEKLGIYVESTAKSLATLKVTGLPTTILIDREGREIGRLAGPAEWDSEDAIRLIKAALK